MMQGRKAFFVCVEEKDRPGSIQVIRGDLSEKVFEIQAHSLRVERLRLSYDNQTLYSASDDGSLCVFEVCDKDPKKKLLDMPSMIPNHEILIQMVQRD
jgi:WD40 repeat protein